MLELTKILLFYRILRYQTLVLKNPIGQLMLVPNIIKSVLIMIGSSLTVLKKFKLGEFG